jgi:hypothetical protein
VGGDGFGLGSCRPERVDPKRQRLRQLVDGYAHAVKPIDSFARRTFPRESDPQEPVVSFASTQDKTYRAMLAIIREGQKLALAEPRVDMPGSKIIPGKSRQPFPPTLPAKLPILRAVAVPDGVMLSWDRRTDLLGVTFELHRSPTPDFTPDEHSRLVELTRSDYLDSAAPPGTLHYALICVADGKQSRPVRDVVVRRLQTARVTVAP